MVTSGDDEAMRGFFAGRLLATMSQVRKLAEQHGRTEEESSRLPADDS